METGEEVYYRVLLNDELKEWIELLRNENDDWAIYILQKIIILSLKTEYSGLENVDSYLRTLTQLRLHIMDLNANHNLND